MIDKIDICQIVADHVRTLRKPQDQRVSVEDLTLFFGLPVLSGFLYLVFSGSPPIDNKIDEVLVASFSIFAALMLNIQVFLLGVKLPARTTDENIASTEAEDRALHRQKTRLRTQFFKELFANISYAILISMTVVVVTLIAFFCGIEQTRVVKFIQFIMIIHFSLTLLMVLKRVHVLFAAIHASDTT